MYNITVFCEVLKNRWQVSFSYSVCHFLKVVENVYDGACAKNVPLFLEDVSNAVPASSLLQNFICKVEFPSKGNQRKILGY